MADLHPFRAVRYRDSDPGTLAKLLCPPYDIISPDEQAALHEAHPHNFVRLEFGNMATADDEQSNRYSRAAETLDAWMSAGVLQEDATPALYLYDQNFVDPDGAARRRRSVIGLVRVEPFERRVVLPHEETLSAPKEDRFKLMRATGAQFSPIFALYEDSKGALHSGLDRACEPLCHATTTDGVTHELARVTSAAAIGAAAEFVRDRALLIADGHHRYETALRYASVVDERAGGGDGGAARYALFALTALSDPGLVVLPTHRVVFGLGARAEPTNLTARLRTAGFKVELFDERHRAHAALANTPRGCAAFVIVWKHPAHAAQKSIGATVMADEMSGSSASTVAAGAALVSTEIAELDVVVLHRNFFEGILEIDRDAQMTQRNLAYVKGEAALYAAVDEGQAEFGVLLRATPVDDVYRVAMSGRRLPQKSTFFIPKVVSGLFFRRFEC